MLAVFRSVRPILLGVMTVAIGLATAFTAVVLTYRELHLITLVFGASLIGEAIDYSIQYFAIHAGSGRDWEPGRALAAVRPGLTLALATSLLGYIALWLTPFSAISQIALFALVGLVAAWLSVVLLLPALLRRPHPHDLSALSVPAGRLVEWWLSRVGRGAAAVSRSRCFACVPGWLRLHGARRPGRPEIVRRSSPTRSRASAR
jgi:predicted exporter